MELINAANDGNLASVQYHIEQGVDIESVNKDGYTALFVAARDGRLDIVEYLVEQGANINHRDRWGRTVSNIAERRRRLAVVEYLRGIYTQRSVAGSKTKSAQGRRVYSMAPSRAILSRGRKSTRVCAGTKLDGTRCSRTTKRGSKYCWQHKK